MSEPRTSRGPRFWLALGRGRRAARRLSSSSRCRACASKPICSRCCPRPPRTACSSARSRVSRIARAASSCSWSAPRSATGCATPARHSRRTLSDSGAFARVDFTVDDRYLRAARAERVMRSSLLGARQREQLKSGDLAGLERDALRAAYTPLGFARRLRHRRRSAGHRLGGVRRTVARHRQRAARRRHPGRARRGKALGRGARGNRGRSVPHRNAGRRHGRASRPRAPQPPACRADASVEASGVVLHAAAAASKAQAEIATFGTIDLLAVVLLIVLVFRMLRPLLFTLVTLGIATTAAIAACQFVFGNVHILTLTFGTSLIGVSVDYSLHYFVNRMRDGAARPHNIVPALILGCTTTVAGYLTLVRRADPGAAADRLVLGRRPGRRLRLRDPHLSWTSTAARCSARVPALGRPLRRRARGKPAAARRVVGRGAARDSPRAPGASRACSRSMTCARCSGRRPSSSRPKSALRSLLGVGFDTRFVLVTAPHARARVAAARSADAGARAARNPRERSTAR